MTFLDKVIRRCTSVGSKHASRAKFSACVWDPNSPSDVRWAASCADWVTNDQGGARTDISLEEILDEAAGAGYSALRLRDAGVGMSTAAGKPMACEDFFIPEGPVLLPQHGFQVVDCPIMIDLTKELTMSTLNYFDSVCQQLSQYNNGGVFAPTIVIQDMTVTDSGALDGPEEKEKTSIARSMLNFPFKPFALPRRTDAGDFEHICSTLEFLKERAMDKFHLEVLFHPKSDGRISKPETIKEFLSKTSLSYVFDTGHLVWASERKIDLVTFADETKERIGVFHFKDIDPLLMHDSFERGWSWRHAVSQGMIPKLGAGLVHFKKLLEWMLKENYKGFVVVRRASKTDPKNTKDFSLMQRRAVSLMMDKRVNTAVVGVGKMGLVHLRHAFSNPRFNVTHILDTNEEQGVRTAEEFGLEYASSLESIVSKVDAVICVSPTKTHKEYIEYCAKNKLHIFCEMPVAESTEDIEHCFDICSKMSVRLVTGFQRRFDPLWRVFKADIKELGAPIEAFRMVDAEHPCPSAAYLKNSGGIFSSLALHNFDQLQWILKEPIKTVQAQVSTFSPSIQNIPDGQNLLEDSCIISLIMESGALATIHCTRRSNTYDQRMEVFTESGTLSAGHDPNDPAIKEKYNSCSDRYRESYYNLLNHFADRIMFNVKPEVTKEEIIASTVIAELCEQSAAAGGIPVKFPTNYVPKFPLSRKSKMKKF